MHDYYDVLDLDTSYLSEKIDAIAILYRETCSCIDILT